MAENVYHVTILNLIHFNQSENNKHGCQFQEYNDFPISFMGNLLCKIVFHITKTNSLSTAVIIRELDILVVYTYSIPV